MRIVVTGATGLLGNNIVRMAIDKGHEVVAVSRTASKSKALSGLRLEPVDSDVTDWDGITSKLTGPVPAVVHCAAHIHIGWKQLEQGHHINGNGTRNALRFAEERGCRCIHVSTVNTLTVGSKNRIVEEDTPGDGQVPCTYVVTKRAAEQETRAYISRGGDAVIVYPGFMLGPWDWKPSSGRMICDLRSGAPPWAPSGGCSVCDPRDVASAILAAMDRAPRGGRFILGGENWTYMQLWREITSQLGSRKPLITMRYLVPWIAGTVGDCIGRLTSEEPIINSAAIAMGSQFHWYSSERAAAQLGYRSRPAQESIRDAIAWLRQYEYIPKVKS